MTARKTFRRMFYSDPLPLGGTFDSAPIAKLRGKKTPTADVSRSLQIAKQTADGIRAFNAMKAAYYGKAMP